MLKHDSKAKKLQQLIRNLTLYLHIQLFTRTIQLFVNFIFTPSIMSLSCFVFHRKRQNTELPDQTKATVIFFIIPFVVLRMLIL